MRHRYLRRLAEIICRQSGWVVAVGVLLAVAAGIYAALELQFKTSRNDLIGRDSEYWRLYSEYAREFRDEEDYLLVVESPTPARNQEAIDALVKALLDSANNPHPNDASAAQQFTPEDVYYRTEFAALERRFLYFLSVPELAEIRGSIKEFQQLVAVLRQQPELVTFFDAMNQMLQQMANAPEAERRRMESFLPTVSAIVTQMANFRGGAEAELLSPWASAFFSEEMVQEAEQQMRWKGYNVFADGRMFVALVHPRANAGGPGTSAATVAKLRRILRESNAKFPDVKMGLTGESVMDLDEMQTSEADATRATLLTLALCGLLFIFSFRELLRPLLATLALVLIVALSLGWAALAIGYLNIITITFTVMIIGLGIDLGIQIISRYEEERAQGADPRTAVIESICCTGPSIITAALTNAAAFFAMGLSGFKGVIELGIIAGGGMILALMVMLLVLPALLLATRRKAESTHIPGQTLAARVEQVFHRHPILVIIICLAVTAGALATCWRVGFDYNVLNLQSRGLESVEIEKRLLKTDAQSTIFAAVVCDSFEQARTLQHELEQRTNTVQSVASIVPLVPERQEEKAALIREIQQQLGDPRLAIKPVESVDAQPVLRALQSLRLQATRLLREAADRNDAGAIAVFGSLTNTLVATRTQLADQEPGALATRLAQYQQRFFADLQAQLQMMADQVTDRPMTIAEIPAEIRRMLMNKTGTKFLLRVFPKENIWDRDPLVRFVDDVKAVAPKATGTPMGIYEFIAILRHGYISAAWWAFLVIAVLVAIDFRNLRATILTLLPLGVGMLWMIGATVVFGIPFNPANIMVLPLLVGIGVAYGIYVMQRYREDGQTTFFTKSTGRAVVLSGLTTVVGFGSLMVGKHQGIFSLGLVMSIGVTACLVSSLTFLPALLEIARRKGWKV